MYHLEVGMLSSYTIDRLFVSSYSFDTENHLRFILSPWEICYRDLGTEKRDAIENSMIRFLFEIRSRWKLENAPAASRGRRAGVHCWYFLFLGGFCPFVTQLLDQFGLKSILIHIFHIITSIYLYCMVSASYPEFLLKRNPKNFHFRVRKHCTSARKYVSWKQ